VIAAVGRRKQRSVEMRQIATRLNPVVFATGLAASFVSTALYQAHLLTGPDCFVITLALVVAGVSLLRRPG
jgi:hypothetical protein